MQFAFTELPRYHFDLRLLGGNVTSLPFIEDWLDGVIASLLEPFTLPEKVQPSREVPYCWEVPDCCSHTSRAAGLYLPSWRPCAAETAGTISGLCCRRSLLPRGPACTRPAA